MRHQSRILVIQWLALHAQISIIIRLRVKVVMLDQSLRLEKRESHILILGGSCCVTCLGPNAHYSHHLEQKVVIRSEFKFTRPVMLSYSDVCEQCIKGKSIVQWGVVLVVRDSVRWSVSQSTLKKRLLVCRSCIRWIWGSLFRIAEILVICVLPFQHESHDGEGGSFLAEAKLLSCWTWGFASVELQAFVMLEHLMVMLSIHPIIWLAKCLKTKETQWDSQTSITLWHYSRLLRSTAWAWASHVITVLVQWCGCKLSTANWERLMIYNQI